jgi:diguanylate cyclase (GGDEF)-like protein
MVGLVGIFFAAAIAAAFVAQGRGQDATRWVEHTEEVNLAIANARIHLRDAELDQARGNSPRTSLLELQDDARALRRLTADNRRQQSRLDAFDLLLAQAISLDGRDWQSDGVRRVFTELRGEEDTLMAQRQAAEGAAWQRSKVAFGLSAAVTLALLAGAVATLIRQHDRMSRQAALLESVLESIGDAVLAVDTERRFLVANAAARRMFQHPVVGERLPQDWATIHGATSQNGESLTSEEGAMSRALLGRQSDDVTFFLKRADRPQGTWVSANGRPVRGTEGAIFGGVAVYRDVSEQRRQAEELQSLSLTDELTGLTNRRGFSLLAEQHARLAARTKTPFGLLFADMNGLKTINDAFGHEAGDRAIRDMARVLRTTLRETDIVARFGGDEFVALLANAAPEDIAFIERRLRVSLEQENARHEASYWLSVSTGVAMYDPHSPRTLKDILAEADQRMYANKSDRQRKSSSLLRAARRS